MRARVLLLVPLLSFAGVFAGGRVAEGTHQLARTLKDGLADVPGVTVVTPRDEELSAGIVRFALESLSAREAVDFLGTRHRIVASVTPYADELVRLGPSIANDPEDVEAALRAVRALV